MEVFFIYIVIYVFKDKKEKSGDKLFGTTTGHPNYHGSGRTTFISPRFKDALAKPSECTFTFDALEQHEKEVAAKVAAEKAAAAPKNATAPANNSANGQKPDKLAQPTTTIDSLSLLQAGDMSTAAGMSGGVVSEPLEAFSDAYVEALAESLADSMGARNYPSNAESPGSNGQYQSKHGKDQWLVSTELELSPDEQYTMWCIYFSLGFVIACTVLTIVTMQYCCEPDHSRYGREEFAKLRVTEQLDADGSRPFPRKVIRAHEMRTVQRLDPKIADLDAREIDGWVADRDLLLAMEEKVADEEKEDGLSLLISPGAATNSSQRVSTTVKKPSVARLSQQVDPRMLSMLPQAKGIKWTEQGKNDGDSGAPEPDDDDAYKTPLKDSVIAAYQ